MHIEKTKLFILQIFIFLEFIWLWHESKTLFEQPKFLECFALAFLWSFPTIVVRRKLKHRTFNTRSSIEITMFGIMHSTMNLVFCCWARRKRYVCDFIQSEEKFFRWSVIQFEFSHCELIVNVVEIMSWKSKQNSVISM